MQSIRHRLIRLIAGRKMPVMLNMEIHLAQPITFAPGMLLVGNTLKS
ncbi:hypothetical protein [Paenibacillus sp. P22]|nr:hypothetical protein [Paenibacillus sp. P22]CDN41944.1 hypothetical protein BN871_AQ_00150 [Paenibacillus sp. P22]